MSPPLQSADIPGLPLQCHQLCYLPNVLQGQVAEDQGLRLQDKDAGRTVKYPTEEGSIRQPTALSEEWVAGG